MASYFVGSKSNAVNLKSDGPGPGVVISGLQVSMLIGVVVILITSKDVV